MNSERTRVARTGALAATISVTHPGPWERLERRVLGKAPTARRALIARRSGLVAAIERLKELKKHHGPA